MSSGAALRSLTESTLGGAAPESAVAIAVLPSLAFVLTLYDLNILVTVAALWGLVGYLLYLFLGRHLLVPLSILYGSLYVLLLYYITASDPVRVSLTMGSVGLVFGNQIQGPILAVLVLLLIGPEFLGAILYFTLYFRTRDPTVRYRIALVSWSLIGWFGLSLVPIASGLGGGLAAQVLARSLGIIAALVILAAYYPPRAVRSAFGVVSVDENPPSPVASSS